MPRRNSADSIEVPTTAETATAPAQPGDAAPFCSTVFTGAPTDVGDYAHRVSRSILDASQDGIYGLNLKGFVTFMNPAAQRMTGWSLDDMRGRTQHSMVHHSHADGSPYQQQDCPIYRALRDGETHHRENEVFWRKDGSSFPVSYTSTPVVSHGCLTGAVVVFQDITNLAQERAWQQSRGKVLQSVRDMKPFRETLSRIREAVGVLMATDNRLHRPAASRSAREEDGRRPAL